MAVRKTWSAPSRSARAWLWAGLLLCAVLGLLFLGRSTGRQSPGSLNEGSEKVLATQYAGSATCASCHAEEYRLWSKSHHGQAERDLDASQDRAAFATTRFNSIARISSSSRKGGDSYEILALGPYRTQEVFTLTRVIGDSPLRQFLTPFPGGRIQVLDVAFDPLAQDWFNVYGNENRQPGEWGHWTGRGMNWNSMCAACHNTGVTKGYDPAADSYHTSMAEPTVSCEACHGPLRAHNDWQKKFGSYGGKDPTLKKLTPAQTLDNCGVCHARRGELTGRFKPGDDFLDHLSLEIVDGSDTFYPDGQVREEDYEYAAFLGSRMHFRGVTCNDCHEPHSGKTLLPGNWLCMRCHAGGYPNAPVIDPIGHSHHKVFGAHGGASPMSADLRAYPSGGVPESGGDCVNCHMPQTTYMQRHQRHDHGFTTPDPLLTKTTGVPNACNRCHQDKDPGWALNWCDQWYGKKMNRPARARSMVFAAARKTDPAAKTSLLEVYRSSEIPYWRAAAAGLLEPWAAEAPVRDLLVKGLADTNALVRISCIRALRAVAQEQGVSEALSPRLTDPVRAVRYEAAWALRSLLEPDSKAGAELQECLAYNADQPSGQMQLGAFALARSQPGQAAAHYAKAVEWDPGSAGLRHDYAVVLAGLQRTQDAVKQLEAACTLEPTNAAYQYSLALGYGDLGQTSNTIRHLENAVGLQPGFGRAWYNLGLALSAAERPEEALQALNRAEGAEPSDPATPYAEATILMRIGRVDEAETAAKRALEIDSKFTPARELLGTLQVERKKPGQ